MKIFIADSNNEAMEGMVSILNRRQPDWTVVIMNSGKQCLDTLRNGSCPDAFILGIQLTDMSGLELVIKIRDDSDMPIIVLSSDEDIHTLVETFDAGANDYIVKPFNEVIFVARLKALVRRRIWNSQAIYNQLK